ncbi:MAG: hypothetical protein ABSF97_08025 [Candidatus Sulfotelmatobacter sp.]|jgi:hypothetical protein
MMARPQTGIWRSRGSEKGFGPRAGITGGSAHAPAMCLMGLNRFEEASRLLENIDIDTVTQLSGDATVSPSIALAKGQIAAQREDFASGDLTQSRQTSI